MPGGESPIWPPRPDELATGAVVPPKVPKAPQADRPVRFHTSYVGGENTLKPPDAEPLSPSNADPAADHTDVASPLTGEENTTQAPEPKPEQAPFEAGQLKAIFLVHLHNFKNILDTTAARYPRLYQVMVETHNALLNHLQTALADAKAVERQAAAGLPIQERGQLILRVVHLRIGGLKLQFDVRALEAEEGPSGGRSSLPVAVTSAIAAFENELDEFDGALTQWEAATLPRITRAEPDHNVVAPQQSAEPEPAALPKTPESLRDEQLERDLQAGEAGLLQTFNDLRSVILETTTGSREQFHAWRLQYDQAQSALKTLQGLPEMGDMFGAVSYEFAQADFIIPSLTQRLAQLEQQSDLTDMTQWLKPAIDGRGDIHSDHAMARLRNQLPARVQIVHQAIADLRAIGDSLVEATQKIYLVQRSQEPAGGRFLDAGSHALLENLAYAVGKLNQSTYEFQGIFAQRLGQTQRNLDGLQQAFFQNYTQLDQTLAALRRRNAE